jgi:16S rRNA (adenine1518-N6/adenine1519-N6)-dimethyltransferase
VTLSPRRVRELLDEHGLAPSRALGQNFVADANTVRRIAALAEVGPGDRVVEVGAGLGSLTVALAETGAAITAVEMDRRLVPILRELVEPEGVRVVEGDARALDWSSLLAGDRWALVANLPYNIATPLILDLLADVPAIGRMLVMVQREAGERLAARAGDDAYGIPSVKVAYWGEARVVGRVPATVFVPQPRVESVLVRVVRHAAPPVGAEVDRARLFRLVDAGFGQRRKMLRRSLAGLVDAGGFAEAGVAPEARAEDLTLQDWAALTRAAATAGVDRLGP